MTDPKSVTDLIEAAKSGDSIAANQLWASVYQEIRAIAKRAIDKEYGPSSVQATEIAHEAYLRLAGNVALGIENRSHLLATVAMAIRRLLVDRARARKADKRGGELVRVLLDDVIDSVESDLPDLLDLDQALTELESIDSRHAKLIELRFFGGMTLEEAASVLEVSPRTAAGDWALAKAWLRRRLGESNS